MKNRKRILSLALALVLCLGLAVPGLAAESDFTIENGVLTNYNGPGGDVVIPDGVTAIGWSAFAGCADLTSVTIPAGVTEIGDRAFVGCTELVSVNIPDSVTEIGGGAFAGCADLTSIIVPEGVTKIGDRAFTGCANLTSVTIPDSVTEIGEGVFYGCTSLTNVTIPESVTEIVSHTFMDCTSLTSATIPDSVTTIGIQAFEECTGLTDVYYGGSAEQWKKIVIGVYNDPLQNATIHYNSSITLPAPTIAYPSTQTVDVDGKAVAFECYALKDENGNLTNYIKLRDLAMLLNGSAAQFQVGWDGNVTITTHSAYTPNGSELSTPYSGDRSYTQSDNLTTVNGQAADLDAFVLNDDAGGGYTYYQLRDLAQVLGFNVGWSADRGMFVETDKTYDPAD